MKSRIAEVMSRILSEKHDAKIKITFKEITDEQRRNNHGVGGTDIDARKRNQKVKA
jgi:hypothetical protein